ncbi:MAG TPA: hypothetical protein VKH81_17625 [Candidatus Angelobacter sp.]|nr:hypothetical protein [Candidatus Angelobacter sp.]
MSERPKVVSGLTAEVAFAILPLLVILMVFLTMHNLSSFFASPEWSFGAAILFGQSFIRFVTGLVHGGKAAQGPVALIIAVLLVFGLTPSMVSLVVILQSGETHSPLSIWMQVLQVALFAFASVAYVVLGTVGEEWNKVRRRQAAEAGAP